MRQPIDMEIKSVDPIPLIYNLGNDQKFGGSREIISQRTATLVRLTTADGAVGWGEAFATPRTVATLINEIFADEITGRTPWDAKGLANEIYTGNVGGYHLARGGFFQAGLSAIEMAMWDLLGKEIGAPVWEILGGESKLTVTPYASTMYFTNRGQNIAEPIRTAKKEGFKAAKIKLGGGLEDDIKRTRVAREILGEEALIMVDYNGNYTPFQAIKSIRALSDYNITWVEEPVPPENLSGYGKINSKVDVPLAAGEAHFGRFEFTNLIKSGIIDIIQPNLGRCGGFAEARYITRMATTENILVRPHVWNSAVGTAAALQFIATVPPYPHAEGANLTPTLFEVDRSVNPLRENLLSNRLELTGECIEIPNEPGLGIEIDEQMLNLYRVEV
jgi:D-galactarolactone cycloisomerase